MCFKQEHWGLSPPAGTHVIRGMAALWSGKLMHSPQVDVAARVMEHEVRAVLGRIRIRGLHDHNRIINCLENMAVHVEM
jgi:hypothetical protein